MDDGIGAMVPHLAGHVIAHRNDRMGARLIAMVNAMRIADALDLPFSVGWTTHGRTSEEIRNPSDIFSEQFISDHFFGGEELAIIWGDLVNLGALEPTTPEAIKSAALKGNSFLSEVTIGSIVLPWEDAATVQAALPHFFRQIPFSPVVTAAMARIDQLFEGLSLRAYHIRRGDIISDPITSEKLWPNKYTPREYYEVHVRQFLKNGGDRCIVFSDTPAEIDRLKAIDERIVAFDDIVPNDGLKIGQRDFLELYSMSKCPEIFGPPESAFSQTAATIGGGTVYAVQTSLTQAEQSIAMELMAKRMEQPKRYFLGDGDVGQNFPFLIAHYEAAKQPAVARDIIKQLVDGGFSRSYAYPQLCKLSLACGDLQAAHGILAAAKRRPIMAEEAMADLYAFTALAHMEKGDKDAALDSIQAAYWLCPLSKSVCGILNMMLTVGWLDTATIYPYDKDLVRNKGRLFPQNNPELDVFNTVPLPGGYTGKVKFYPWDLAVRDWRFIHGKKLSRAFWQKGKLQNELTRLIRSSSNLAGSPQLSSAASIYLRYLEKFDVALNESRQAEAAEPFHPLYAKRSADILLDAGETAQGLFELERATELSEGNPYYLAQLGYWYGKAKMPDDAYATFEKLAEIPHTSVELTMLTSDFLRRRIHSRDRALGMIDDATQMAHGSLRLLTGKARQLLTLDRIDEAATIYRDIAAQRTAHQSVFVQMYRMMLKLDQEQLAQSVIAETQFCIDEVATLADNNQTIPAPVEVAHPDRKAA